MPEVRRHIDVDDPVYISLANIDRYGLKKNTVLRLAELDPSFPKLIRVSAHKTLIKASSLEAWLDRAAGAKEPMYESVRRAAQAKKAATKKAAAHHK